MSEDKRGLIERWLVERMALRGICRAVGVPRTWLVGFLVPCFEALPDPFHVHPVSCPRDVRIQRLEVKADALASLVQTKVHTPWVWIAMDAKTRPIMALHVGDHRHMSAEQLWAKIPQTSRQHATFYTDQ
jgi:insertion element IS1 protein InsB